MSLLRRAVKAAVGSSLGWRIAAATARKRGVTVLMYHRIRTAGDLFPGVDVSVFRDEMQWLRDNCKVIAPEGLRDAASRPPRARPAVLVTFDDGYRDYRDNAYPVLKELGIPALVFLSTAFQDRGGIAWWDALFLAARRTMRREAQLPWKGGRNVSLVDDAGRSAFLSESKARLKAVPDADREAELARVLDALEVDGEALRVDRQMMNWDEVRATSGLTRYGGHTHTHTIMSRLDPARLEEEIRTCRDRIRAETGVNPTFFAYPNGRASDFTEEAKALLRNYGFGMAFTTIEGINDGSTDFMEIRRIPGSGSIPEFAWRLMALAKA